MMFRISKETVERLRKEYPVGCRVQLTKMGDPYNTRLFTGEKGTVKHIDDLGTIHVQWDCGSSLGVVYGEDACRKLDSVTITCYGTTEVWDERIEALRFYKQGAEECEGAESRRYANIVFQLMEGKTVCTDEEDEDE
jgi:hypothetical protein